MTVRKVQRIDLKEGQTAVFRYNKGTRYVYITRGEHSQLTRGKPVKLEPDQELSITAESDIQVSHLYD